MGSNPTWSSNFARIAQRLVLAAHNGSDLGSTPSACTMKGNIMQVKKLELFGYKHGAGQQPISSYYTWPLGTTLEHVGKLIDGFCKAFTGTRVEIYAVPAMPVDFIRINSDCIIS